MSTNKRNKFAKAVRRQSKANKTDAQIEQENNKREAFVFLGLNKQVAHKGKSNVYPKNNRHPLIEEIDDEDDEDIHQIKGLPLIFPQMGALFGERAKRDELPDEYCTEIVDQLRHNNNSLIDEIKGLRKEAKEYSDSSNKQMITAIKELQSELKKTLVEELPKIMKK